MDERDTPGRNRSPAQSSPDQHLTLRFVTGLIYLVIIALWAAVLIPIWLRRHDQISEVRSTARFSSAMRSLGSQGQVQYAMDMAVPPGVPQVTEVRMMRPSSAALTEGMDPSYERELARQSAATRRAVVLGVLTLLLLAALVLAVASFVPRWAPLMAALPVVAFVLATAMTASERSVRRAPEQRERPRTAAPAAQAMAPAAAAQDDWETWNAWDDEDSWDAVPTTLPTYVTAPRASQVPRGIDRSRPGEWTGSAMVETAQAMRRRGRPLVTQAADVDFGAETAEMPAVDSSYERQRAANE